MRSILTFGCGLIVGSAVWLLSPLLTGRVEPWDSNLWYFVGSLTVIGVAAGLLLRRYFWAAMFGMYCGEAVIMFTRSQEGSDRAPWWAGALMLGLFSLIAVVAGLIPVLSRRFLKL